MSSARQNYEFRHLRPLSTERHSTYLDRIARDYVWMCVRQKMQNLQAYHALGIVGGWTYRIQLSSYFATGIHPSAT
jgi:hypothetical protein